MTLFKRNELASLLKNKEQISTCPVFLFAGERYLCHEAADTLQAALLDEGGGAVHPIDGDREDSAQTLAKLRSLSLLPGQQIYRVSDSRIFHSKIVAETIWQKGCQSFEKGNTSAASRHILGFAHLGSVNMQSPTPLSEITDLQWQKLFNFTKPAADLVWADQLVREAVGTGKVRASATSTVDLYIEAFTAGISPSNCLILTAETVDKRQRLYACIKKHGIIIDCSVASGAGAAAQKAQKEVLKELMGATLREFSKTIEPQALDMLFDRVGFHPVAVVTETEKLALYVGDHPRITCADLDQMVGRCREDALFELTDAFGKRQLGRTLIILNRLQENGTHGLAIMATMRNYIRKLLIFKTLQLQPTPLWQSGMTAHQFQNSYLPTLKETTNWSDQLGGHPYALFMSFTKAAEFSCNQLKKWLTLLLKAEYRLKGSPLPQQMVLEELFLAMLTHRESSR